MLQLYDLNKVKISNLTLYKDLKIQSVLSTGDKTLSFLYPSRSSDEIKEEGYIRTKTHEFVIKEISTNGDWKSIQAVINVEDLEGKTWEHFDTSNQTITECLKLALAGTGWMIGYCNETKKRTISKTNCSTWDIIQEIKKTYFVEMEFDTLDKRINIAKKLGNDKGVYFIDSLNLKDLDVKSNSYDFCTRLIAIGKDDLKVTVENYQYSSKKKTIIWKDEKYTDENSLREDAIAKLEELSKPYKSYGADIVDLASINDRYSILSYGLGDIITLISKEEGIKEKQRIVKMVEYPDEPDKNTCEIANTVLTFEDMQKEYEDTSKTVNNITSSNGTISEGAIKGTVEKITIKKADIESLNAVKIRVGDLEATSATITDLKAANANIAELQASKADIGELKASVGRIDILESNVGDIETLVNGNLTSSNIHSLILTSDKVTVDNGFIKNAMIENLDVSKINAGDISTNKFKIKSDNGGIEIAGATQQFKDKNNKVRIQMGQDTKGDFNFILRGEDGTTTLIDHTGIKEKAIANDLIKGNMVATDAIGEKQINYSSLITGLNKDTNTQLIKASKVALDTTGQSLEVSFNSLSNTVYADPPSITTDSSITKLDGAIDGMLKLNSIKGRTLQNLFRGSQLNFTWGISPSNRLYAFDITNSNMNKPSVYTIFNTTNKKLGYDINHKDTNQYIRNLVVDEYSKKSITLVENEKIFGVYALESNGWTNTQADKDILKQSTLILEGDWSNKEIPSYFESIRSVGESGENLEIVSCGKNLFKNDSTLLKKGFYFSSTGEYTTISINSVLSEFYIKIDNTKNYAWNGIEKNIIIATYNSDKTFIERLITYSGTIINSIKFKENVKYIRVSSYEKGVEALNDFQLEYGTTPTTYEPYQEHRQAISLTEPLRGLPSNVMDIVKGNVLTRNVGKVVLNGSVDENWSLQTSALNTTNTIVFNFINPLIRLKENGNDITTICDKFPSKLILHTCREDFEGVSQGSNGNYLQFRILKSKLTTQDVVGLKAWLQANPVTIYYQLATPVETPIDVTQYMKQFKDGYFLTDGSLINPAVDLTYSTSIASATSMMKEVTESNTTALNIQQGKISTLISNTTVEKDGQTIQLKDVYNSTVATVDSINSVISKHTSTIDALTGQITGVDTKVNTIQRDLDGVKTSVSKTKTTAESALSKATEAKQTADGFSQRVSNIETNYATTEAMNTAITQSASGIKTEVSNTFVSKADATLTYATKSSVTQSANEIRFEFSGVTGKNNFKTSSGDSYPNGKCELEHHDWGYSAYMGGGKAYRWQVTGNACRARFSKCITQNGVYSVSFFAKSLGGNYPTLTVDLCDNGNSQSYGVRTEWVLCKYENIKVSNYTEEVYNFLDINCNYSQSLPWDMLISNIMINEGPQCLPWSENGSELIAGSTQIDANGVTIYNGALKVTNANSQVVIDGKYNMHKIVATGIITLELPIGITERTYYVQHNLGFMPAHSCYEMLDTTRCIALPAMSLANVGDSFGFSDILRARADTTKLYLDFIRTESEKNKYQSAKVRYFIYKEVAF